MSHRIYHELSKGLHGSNSCPRSIYEGGVSGWDPNEAAALSVLLDFYDFPYDYFVNDEKVDPPPLQVI